MTPVVHDQSALVVVAADTPLLSGASRVTPTGYLRVGEVGDPASAALLFTDVESVERLAASLSALAGTMRVFEQHETPASPRRLSAVALVD